MARWWTEYCEAHSKGLGLVLKYFICHLGTLTPSGDIEESTMSRVEETSRRSQNQSEFDSG